MSRTLLTASVLTVLTPLLTAQSGWSVPVLETALNSTASDSGVNLSLDGLTLHFSSFRSGNWEIYSSTRASIGAPWSVPAVVAGPSDPTLVDDQPHLSADGLSLYFASNNRPGGAGSTDILVCARTSPQAPWGAPTLVSELNSSAADSTPSLTADGLEVFFYSTGWGNPSGNNNSMFVATRTSTSVPFGTPQLVLEFSNANTHRDCEVSPDGLSIAFTEYVAPRIRVMHSERMTRTSPWSPPMAWIDFDTVGTSLGVYSFTRSLAGNEAFVAAGFPAASGSQEILSTAFTGLTHQGAAGIAQVMSIGYHDPGNPGKFFVLGAALGNTGFPIGARIIPLDPDWLLVGTFGVSVPGYTAGWSGQLDGAGQAAASLTNASPAFTGLSFWIGGFTWDGTQPFGVGTIMNTFQAQFQ